MISEHFLIDIGFRFRYSDKYTKSSPLVWFGLSNAMPADGFWSALAHFDGIKTIYTN